MPAYRFGSETVQLANEDEAMQYAEDLGLGDYKVVDQVTAAPQGSALSAGADVFSRLRDLPSGADPKTRAALFDEVNARYEADKAKMREISSKYQPHLADPKLLREMSRRAAAEARAAGLEGVDVSSIKNYIRSRTGGKVKRGIWGALEAAGSIIQGSKLGQMVGEGMAHVPGLKDKTAWEREYEGDLAQRGAIAEKIARESSGMDTAPRVTAAHLKAADAEMGKSNVDYSSFDSWMKTAKAGSPKDLSKFSAREQYKSDVTESLAAAAAPEVDASAKEIIANLPSAIFSKQFFRGFTDPVELVATLATYGIGKGVSAGARGVTGARRGISTSRNVAKNALRSAELQNRLERTLLRASAKASPDDLRALDEALLKARELYGSKRFARSAQAVEDVEKTRRKVMTKSQKAIEVAGKAAKAAPHWAGETVAQSGISHALTGQKITPEGMVGELVTGGVMTAPTTFLSRRARTRAERARIKKMADADVEVPAVRETTVQPLQNPTPELPPPAETPAALPPGVDPNARLQIGMREENVARQMPNGVIEVEPSAEGLAISNARTERLNDITAAVDEQRRAEQEPLARQLERNRIAQVTDPLAKERDIRAREAEVGGPAAAAQRTNTLDAMAKDLGDARSDIAARQEAGYVASPPQAPPVASTAASPAAPEAKAPVQELAEKMKATRGAIARGDLPAVKENAIKVEVAAKAEARKAQSEARRTVNSILNNSRQRAMDGDHDGAIKALDDAKETFTKAYGANADLEMDTARRRVTAAAEKRKKRAPVERQKTVDESDARTREGIQEIKQAKTRDEVDAIKKAYEAPVRDARPRARRIFNDAAEAQAGALEASKLEKAQEPTPEAATPSTPASEAPAAEAPTPPPERPANPATGFKRRKVSGGGKSIEIPGIEENAAVPASASLDLINSVVDDASYGLTTTRAFDDIIRYAAGDDKKLADNIIYKVQDFIEKSITKERMDDMRLLSEREKVEAEGDLDALAKFDDENGLLEPGQNGGLRGEEMRLQVPLSPGELAFLHEVVRVAETGTASSPMPKIPNVRRAGTTLSMLGTAEIEDAAVAAAKAGAWVAGKAAEIANNAWEKALTPQDDLRRLFNTVMNHPAATDVHRKAMRNILDGINDATTKNNRIVSNLRSRLQTGMARTPMGPMRSGQEKVFQVIRDNVEGRLPDDKLPSEYVVLRDVVRSIWDDLRKRANGITGSVGRENYWVRCIDRKFITKVHESLGGFKDGLDKMSNEEAGRAVDNGAVSTQGVRAAIEAATDDMERLFKIVRNERGDLVVRFVGDENDVPGIFALRPQREDGSFMPGLLPELFEDVKHDASYAGPTGMVKPKDLFLNGLTPDQAREDLRRVLRGANAKAISHMWDPDASHISPSAQQRSRTWQLDGSLTQRRMFPDLGPTAYLGPLASMEQAIERQTAGLSRLEAFGAKKFDDEGNYIGYSHKQKLERDLTTLADLVKGEKLGVVEEGGGRRRLASSADEKSYMNSYLRSIEDIMMGYMRPFKEKTWIDDAFRYSSAISSTLAIGTKTGPVSLNELSGFSMALAKYGPTRAAKLALTRADVMRLQSSGALARAGLRTLGMVGTPAWREHMRDMVSEDVLEVYRAMGMGDNPGANIHDNMAERVSHVLSKALGAFGNSVDGMSLAYHMWAHDMLCQALATAKRDMVKPGNISGRLKRAKSAVTGTGDYEIIREARRIMGEKDFSRAMDLIDSHGNPLGEGAYDELLSLGMPFVMDVKSLTAGSSSVGYTPKLWRSRLAVPFGWMMKTVISLSVRPTEEVLREPTKYRKAANVGRRAAAAAAGGATYFLLGGAPMATKIAFAFGNGALLPTAVGLTAAMGGFQGSGDEERRRKYLNFVEGVKEGSPRAAVAAVAMGLPNPLPGTLRDPAKESVRKAAGFEAWQKRGKFSEIPVGPLMFVDVAKSVTDMAASGGPIAAAAAFPSSAEWFGERAEGYEPSLKQQAKANKAAMEMMPNINLKTEGYGDPAFAPSLESVQRGKVQEGVAKGKAAELIGE